MKTLDVWQFSNPVKVSFRSGKQAQSTGSILFSVYTRCLRGVTGSSTAVHPCDWGYASTDPEHYVP